MRDVTHDRPHETARFRIHTSGGLVEQNNLRSAKESNSNAKLAFVTATQSLGQFQSVLVQAKLLNCLLHNMFAFGSGDTLDLRIVVKMLLAVHVLEDQVVLRAVPDLATRFFELSHHVVPCH